MFEDYAEAVGQIGLLALIAALWRASEPRRSRIAAQPATCGCKLTQGGGDVSLATEPRARSRDLPPQVQEWQMRELRRYREAQERKWRNWYDAMFGTEP